MLLACLLTLSIQQDAGEWRKLDRDLEALAVLRIYEVRNLLDLSGPEPAPVELGRIGVPARDRQPAGDPRPPPRTLETATPEELFHATENLAALVQRHMRPAFDPALHQLRAVSGGSLLVSANAEQHAWVTKFFQAQQTSQGLIQTDARMFTVSREAFERTRVTSGSVFASKAEGDAFVAALRASPTLTELSAPRVTTFVRQRANIAIVEPFAFVQDWIVEIVEPGKQEIGDPQIAVINEGLVLDVRAMPMPEGKILAEIALQRCEVARPVRTERVTIGGSKKHEVEISLPVVDTVRLASDVLLADGAGVVFTSAMLKQDEVFVALVTLRFAPSEAPPSAK